MRATKVFIVILAAGLTLVGCSLLGPSPRRIEPWFEFPAPGTIYTYTITTTWHDTSETIETRSYVVERIEEREDRTTLVKLADQGRPLSINWIVDRANDALYESIDTVIDEDDILVLLAPVDEGERWSHGDGDYTISRISKTRQTPVGEAKDVVEVSFDYDGIINVELLLEWAPSVGLLYYEESYDAGTSYIAEYVRELTEITLPAE